MVIDAALRSYRDRFLKAGIENGANEARQLLSFVLRRSVSELLLYGETALSSAEESRAEELAQKRLSGLPLAYVLGTSEFFGRPFFVSPDVLIPRPETEQLTEEALLRLPSGGNFLDLCTGSGCIAVTLAAERKDLCGAACDLSQSALAVACKNAKTFGVLNRVRFFEHDLLSGLPDVDAVDVIVSNPPYIPQAVLKSLDREVFGVEPTMALDGGTDGLDFYRALSESYRLLKPGGWLLLEIGYDQRAAVEELLHRCGGFKSVVTKPDYAGLDRMVLAQRGTK